MDINCVVRLRQAAKASLLRFLSSHKPASVYGTSVWTKEIQNSAQSSSR